MTRDEYERRKRRLEEELRSGMELLEAAHCHQIRALELVWAATGGDGVAIPPPVGAPAAMEPCSRRRPSVPRPGRRKAGELLEAVRTALAQVPEVFNCNDTCRALGYEPDRGSLYRPSGQRKQEGLLAVEQRGSRKLPARYRRTGGNASEAVE